MKLFDYQIVFCKAADLDFKKLVWYNKLTLTPLWENICISPPPLPLFLPNRNTVWPTQSPPSHAPSSSLGRNCVLHN